MPNIESMHILCICFDNSLRFHTGLTKTTGVQIKEDREFKIRKAMQMAVLDFQTGLRKMSIRKAAVAYSLAYITF